MYSPASTQKNTYSEKEFSESILVEPDNQASQSQATQPMTLGSKIIADYRERWPSESRSLIKQAVKGSVHGLLFSQFVNVLPTAPQTPATKKLGTLLFEKHDTMFLLGLLTPNKTDYYASSFLVASQTANQDCIIYQGAPKLNTDLVEPAKHTLIRRQFAEKGLKRGLDYLGIYAAFMGLRDLGLTTAMCAIHSDDMSSRSKKAYTVLKYLRDGKN